ncbi:MAG: hypothetical protein HYV28_02385 [Ignavibacteriales bacterium]|nr:hypothetical protein [Ignavibacteriales bacterium]
MKNFTCLTRKNELEKVLIMFSILTLFIGCKSQTKPKLAENEKTVNITTCANLYLDNDLYTVFGAFILMNEYPEAKYYLAIDNVSDSILILTYICQRKDTKVKKIRSLFSLFWKGREIGIITGYENLFIPSTSIPPHKKFEELKNWKTGEQDHGTIEGYKLEKRIKYYTNKEIISDTSNFIIGSSYFIKKFNSFIPANQSPDFNSNETEFDNGEIGYYRFNSFYVHGSTNFHEQEISQCSKDKNTPNGDEDIIFIIRDKIMKRMKL